MSERVIPFEIGDRVIIKAKDRHLKYGCDHLQGLEAIIRKISILTDDDGAELVVDIPVAINGQDVNGFYLHSYDAIPADYKNNKQAVHLLRK